MAALLEELSLDEDLRAELGIVAEADHNDDRTSAAAAADAAAASAANTHARAEDQSESESEGGAV